MAPADKAVRLLRVRDLSSVLVPYSCTESSRGQRLENAGREVAVVDLAAEQGHNLTLKHDVGCTLPLSVVSSSKRALAQPRGRSPLAAPRGRCHAAAECASQQRRSAEAPDAQTPQRSTGPQAFQGVGTVQRQELICPGRASPDQGRARWDEWASAQMARGILAASWAALTLRPASLRLKTDKPPDPEGLVPSFWSPHGGSA